MLQRAIEIRNALHAIPEASEKEEKTSLWLADALKKAGFEVQTNIAGTYGVTGILQGKSAGPTVGICANTDALLHVVDGVEKAMHTCGHDANCAMALACAEKIASDGLEKGALKIIFQPAEENFTGAKALSNAGCLDDVDYLIGGHLRPIAEAKLGQCTPALIHGAASIFHIDVHGKQAHGARPHLGINAIEAATLIVNAVNALKEDPAKSWSAKVTMFNSNGLVTNAIPDKVTLAIDSRAEDNIVMASIQEKIKNIVANVPLAIGASAEITKMGGIPAADYDDHMTAILAESIKEVLGDEGLLAPIKTPGGDDFHFYKQLVPKLKVGFVGIGADLSPGLHMLDMDFNEKALGDGAEVYIRAVKKLLA